MPESFNSWPPVAGLYHTTLVKGGPSVALRIYFGNPIVADEEQDRGPRWCVEVNGKTTKLRDGVTELLDVERFWPWCARNKIDAAEYNYLLAKGAHATKWLPDSPAANPQNAVDFNKMKPVW